MNSLVKNMAIRGVIVDPPPLLHSYIMPTCTVLIISALLKSTKELRVDIMFSSNSEGVGRMTSWMYITWYV